MDMNKAAELVAWGKKRKLRLEYLEDLPSSSVQLKTRPLADKTPVNFPSSTCESSGSYGVLGSFCSSNGSSSDLAMGEENAVTVDQFLGTSNGDTLNRRERSVTSSDIQVESGEMETTARPNESNPRRRLTGEKMPSEDDFEEFFSSAEKNLQKRFTDKYNYDVVKDEPLEGRLEWVQIQQTQP
ncbi:cyclin-dependent kinase inhibitor 7-like isoform X2 [Primulina eburnea]|uniref:cyclin-dependent kinase inhibitor 7-like isoform X2 n=1 Tax=Primulina eburnea TaxID=1245227 RepID=UPI003C6C7418